MLRPVPVGKQVGFQGAHGQIDDKGDGKPRHQRGKQGEQEMKDGTQPVQMLQQPVKTHAEGNAQKGSGKGCIGTGFHNHSSIHSGLSPVSAVKSSPASFTSV